MVHLKTEYMLDGLCNRFKLVCYYWTYFYIFFSALIPLHFRPYVIFAHFFGYILICYVFSEPISDHSYNRQLLFGDPLLNPCFPASTSFLHTCSGAGSTPSERIFFLNFKNIIPKDYILGRQRSWLCSRFTWPANGFKQIVVIGDLLFHILVQNTIYGSFDDIITELYVR